jgi:hypothetical protein
MITESLYEYKGYTIKLRASTGNGFKYVIIKKHPRASSPDGIKWYSLRTREWIFIKPSDCLQKAKDYIDNFSEELNNNFTKKLLK